ncbi:MliC family protein [Methylobacterium sp. Leaf91]|uniref:MliC family protein n=1 Tax=Methylobacterium sp. Leaf91 TaxID=1736247 RepID=UPI000AD0F8A2|nr:MliC family protein [Methylobacterium sp. Leaf91]
MMRLHTVSPFLVAAVMLGMSIQAHAEAPDKTLSRATASEGATTKRVIFSCPKDVLLTVEFVTSDPAQPAIVRPPEGPEITLPAQPSGSGFRYGDDTHELRGKGQEVTWTDQSKHPIVCTEQKPPAGGTEPN